MKKILKIAAIILIVLIVLFASFYVYTLNYYRADDYATKIYETQGTPVAEAKNLTVFYPDVAQSTSVGLIFYPGGKVESTAYAPLLDGLAKEGITCVLVDMPFNLAVFDINAASEIAAKFDNIDTWYISGHSLGGAMASAFVGDNEDAVSGLILLGAYPINDASLPTIAIYGSEDLGLDVESKISESERLEIQGGNHAYFGNYGEQKGDGTASITREDQQKIAINAMVDFMLTH